MKKCSKCLKENAPTPSFTIISPKNIVYQEYSICYNCGEKL